MNAQNSSNTGEWYTPAHWLDAVREVFCGSIDLDPCSSAKANEVVKASTFLTADNLPLIMAWPDGKDVFINPPGSCDKVAGKFSMCRNVTRCSCKLPKQFMIRALQEAASGRDVIYLAFSVNQIRTLAQLPIPCDLYVSAAFPKQRIAYIDPDTMEPIKGTNCDSAFLMFTNNVAQENRFYSVFKAAGCMVVQVQL